MAQPPPTINKRFSKTAQIVVAILAVACVALASTTALLFFGLLKGNYTANNNPSNNNNSQNSTAPDISGVQVLKSTASALMSNDGFASQTPYRFHIYITLQIKNPTQYDVKLRLYGEVNITGSDTEGVISGNHVLDNTIDFSIAKYSQTDYMIPLYVSSWWYSDSNAVSATINNYNVSELWRGIGNPP